MFRYAFLLAPSAVADPPKAAGFPDLTAAAATAATAAAATAAAVPAAAEAPFGGARS
ncbi:hypothetical protein OG204_04595 [Streptomyces sp. NBC_01387]|uniref:hypothetical protein n=1 Tax=unclassified Streptomyces TaxID=2593676 RepID=UPI002023DA53|nr:MULTISPECIES: hypothetical protein [unclassified Streptomyces]MCX4552436.1 hypothetical protein [Streptomyces sp. NBC_01500]WSV57658.1 hypothetical protein OG282_30455 [Streptomyces sp. NBC_01014]